MADVHDDDEPPELLTVREVGNLFRRSPDTVKRMLKAGKLPYINVGTADAPAYRVERVEAMRYLAARRSGAA